MRNFLKYLKLALPFIGVAAVGLAEFDDNSEGADDQAAEFLEYVQTGLSAIIAGHPIPKAPESLR